MIESISDTSCCGMYEFHGFYGVESSWMDSLIQVLMETHDNVQLPPIVLFSGAILDHSDKNPFLFAKWLRRQGEDVVKSKKVRNPNTGNLIQAFLWTPSREFQKKLNELYEKQEEKENNDKTPRETTFTYW